MEAKLSYGFWAGRACRERPAEVLPDGHGLGVGEEALLEEGEGAGGVEHLKGPREVVVEAPDVLHAGVKALSADIEEGSYQGPDANGPVARRGNVLGCRG